MQKNFQFKTSIKSDMTAWKQQKSCRGWKQLTLWGFCLNKDQIVIESPCQRASVYWLRFWDLGLKSLCLTLWHQLNLCSTFCYATSGNRNWRFLRWFHFGLNTDRIHYTENEEWFTLLKIQYTPYSIPTYNTNLHLVSRKFVLPLNLTWF